MLYIKILYFPNNGAVILKITYVHELFAQPSYMSLKVNVTLRQYVLM